MTLIFSDFFVVAAALLLKRFFYVFPNIAKKLEKLQTYRTYGHSRQAAFVCIEV